MRYLELAEIQAIAARTVVARDFLQVTVKHRITGAPVSIGFWSDAGLFTCDIVNGRTGATEEWTFNGGALTSIDDIPLLSDLSVRTVGVELSGVDDGVQQLVRDYDARNAPIQILRGYFSPETHVLVAPAKARFIGFIDEAPIETPAEGGVSKITLSCASHTRELTRTNPDVRSHESQILRKPGDNFYRYAGVVGDWELFWGRKGGKAG